MNSKRAGFVSATYCLRAVSVLQGPLRRWPSPVLDWGRLRLSHYLLLLAL